VKVGFSPTKNMLADFYAKLLQGSMFVCMREKILNLPTSASTDMDRSVLETKKYKEKFDGSRENWMA